MEGQSDLCSQRGSKGKKKKKNVDFWLKFLQTGGHWGGNTDSEKSKEPPQHNYIERVLDRE
jgi:hypothetical protein